MPPKSLPDEQLYVLVMRIIGVLTTIIGAFLIYLIIFQSEQLPLGYRIKYAYNVITTILLHTVLGFLYAPVLVFPYLALYPAGWINGKLPTEWIFSAYVTLLSVAAASGLPLFYYRLRVLLPKTHFLSSCCFYYISHFIYYVVAVIGPPPLLYFAYQNQTDVKLRLWKRFEVIGRKLFDADVVAYDIQHWATLIAMLTLFIGALVFITQLVIFTYWTHWLLREFQVCMSKNMLQEHRMVILALGNTVLVYGLLFSLPTFVMVICASFGKGSVQLSYICASVFTSSVIFSSITMIISTKPYRTFVLSIVRKCCSRVRKKEGQNSSLPVQQREKKPIFKFTHHHFLYLS